MRTWTLLALGAPLAVAMWSCSSDEPKPAKVAAKKPRNPSAWKEIATLVPVGKKLACQTLLPPEKVGPLLARTLTVVDDSGRDPDATSVCRYLNVDKKGKAGDEECMVSVYCWSEWNLADMKQRCDERGEQSSTSDVGLLTCVQRVPAGEKERHVVTTLEPDTRCKVVVNAAPNQYSLDATKACARAVVEVLDQDSLKQ
jgi:hypothetical protein